MKQLSSLRVGWFSVSVKVHFFFITVFRGTKRSKEETDREQQVHWMKRAPVWNSAPLLICVPSCDHQGASAQVVSFRSVSIRRKCDFFIQQLFSLTTRAGMLTLAKKLGVVIILAAANL